MIKTLRLILDRVPESINTQDGEGVTPLMSAVMKSQFDAVKALLEMGASKDIHDAQHRTAKELAVIEGHHEIVEILEDHSKTSRD
jgi:ankyrin repeat protein